MTDRVRLVRSHVAFTPTRRFALCVLAIAPLWLASGWAVGALLAGAALAALIIALAVDVAMLPREQDVELRREFPETVGAGDRVEGRYTIVSRWPRTLHVRLSAVLPARYLSAPDDFAERALAPHDVGELAFETQALSRGETALGDATITARTPLGLASRTFRHHLTERTLVAPSIAGVKRFRWLAVHHRLATIGVRDARRRGEGRSFARLRDYVAGDDPRYIDWKATARRGHPITREFTVEQSQTVFVLLDAGRSMTQISGQFPRFEYALSSTLLLADVALSAGDRVGALVFDDELRALVPAQRGAKALHALRTALVPVQPTLVEPDYATAFRVLGQRQRKRALVVLVTDVLDTRTSRSLLAHLTSGASRHLAVVVALQNEAMLAAASAPVHRVQDVYLSGAAEELVAERLSALQRMRDAGVVVLDVAPGAMASAVVNQYLELKSRGAL